jgi:hypothetical protein
MAFHTFTPAAALGWQSRIWAQHKGSANHHTMAIKSQFPELVFDGIE